MNGHDIVWVQTEDFSSLRQALRDLLLARKNAWENLVRIERDLRGRDVSVEIRNKLIGLHEKLVEFDRSLLEKLVEFDRSLLDAYHQIEDGT